MTNKRVHGATDIKGHVFTRAFNVQAPGLATQLKGGARSPDWAPWIHGTIGVVRSACRTPARPTGSSPTLPPQVRVTPSGRQWRAQPPLPPS